MFKPFNTSQPFFTGNATTGPRFYQSQAVSIAQDSDSNLYLSGAFVNYKKNKRDRFVKLNSIGQLYEQFTENASGDKKFTGQINASAIQSDGKILIGGIFTNYGGTTNRSRLIRLNPDGTLDTAFCVNAVDGGKFNSQIFSLAVQSDGKILVGGGFTSYNGVSGRNRLIRLNSDGTLDTAFCFNACDSNKFGFGDVASIKIESGGKILIGGTFVDYGGTTNRSRLIRLNSDGTLDTAFCVNASDGNKFVGSVNNVIVQSDGKILVGGSFSNYGATVGRNFLIRLNSNGTLDTAFCVNASDSAKFNSSVSSFQTLSDGRILVAGSFTNYNSTGNNYLVCLLSSGSLDVSFTSTISGSAKFNNTILCVYVQSDAKIVVSGNFINYNGVKGRDRLIRLNSNGSIDSDFCNNASDSARQINSVYCSEFQSDNKVLIAGIFTDYGGTTNRNRLIRVNESGVLDAPFCVNASDGNKFNAQIYEVRCQSDGKILVGGSFTNYNAVANRSRFIRLNSTGSLDTAFCVNASDSAKFNNAVYSIAIQSDNKILVAGSFSVYAGIANRNYLVRLNSDGTLDTTFCNNAVDGGKFTQGLFSCVVQTDGKILVGGSFFNYNGVVGRNRLVRLNSDGTLDTAFCVNAVDGGKFTDAVYSINVQSDGKILVAGNFINYNGTSGRDYLVRLNSDGTLDTTFCNNAVDGSKFNSPIYSVTQRQDGVILAAGAFDYNSTTSFFVAFNSNGTLNSASTSFLPFIASDFPSKLATKNNKSVLSLLTNKGYFSLCDKFFNII